MEPLTKEQISFVTNKVSLWVHFRNQNISTPINHTDPSHSSLLQRLLAGDHAFSVPPPCRNGYPDYELASRKKVKVNSFSDNNNGLYVNGCLYEWINKKEGICRYNTTGILFKITEVIEDIFEPGYQVSDISGTPYAVKLDRYIQMFPILPGD